MKNDIQQASENLVKALADFLTALGGQAAPEGPKLYGVPELAELLGKSKDSVRRWIKDGAFGEAVYVGKTPKVTAAGLEKYLADHAAPPETARRSRRRTVMTASGPLERI